MLTVQNAFALLNSIFTYQGELVENNLPANGNYEMNIKYFDAQTNGNIILSNYFPIVAVTNGLFTLDLDRYQPCEVCSLSS